MTSLACLSSIKRQRPPIDYAVTTSRKQRRKNRRIPKSLADIPIELLETIILNVPSFGSLVALSQTCRTFRNLMKQEDFWRETCLLPGFGKAAVYGEARDRVGITWRVLAMSIHWHGTSCYHCSNFYDYTEFVVDRDNTDKRHASISSSAKRENTCLSTLLLDTSYLAVNWFIHPPEPVIGDYLEDDGFEDPNHNLHHHITLASALATNSPNHSVTGNVHSELPYGWYGKTPPVELVEYLDEEMKRERRSWRAQGVTWYGDADRRELAYESAFHYATHDESFSAFNAQGVTCMDALQAICDLDSPPMAEDELFCVYGGLKQQNNGRIEVYFL